MTYKICVKTVQGAILTYKVETYSIQDGFITFKDPKTNIIKHFYQGNCEIEELKEGDNS